MTCTLFTKTIVFAKLITVLISIILTLTSCSVTNSKKKPVLIQQTQNERILALTGLSVWQIKGKIAFLKSGSRNSANLVWKVDNDQNNQQLNLTSYLGINVLKLVSNEGVHTLTVDGNTYQSNDLANLIYSLTGLTLPTEALHFWLKGLAYQQDDLLTYNDITGLPDTLSSQYQAQKWKIAYQGYQQVEQFSLPTQITINQGNLVIKIVIKTWSVFPHLSRLY
jgi:outer membrane lipoprotein LolB